jgi:hypothetical protein
MIGDRFGPWRGRSRRSKIGGAPAFRHESGDKSKFGLATTPGTNYKTNPIYACAIRSSSSTRTAGGYTRDLVSRRSPLSKAGENGSLMRLNVLTGFCLIKKRRFSRTAAAPECGYESDTRKRAKRSGAAESTRSSIVNYKPTQFL